MTIPLHSLVAPADVFALTKKGEAELKGSGTALDPQALELLVRMDGKSSVAHIVAGMKAVPAQTVLEGIAKLLASGHIDRASKMDDGSIDFDFTGGSGSLSAAAMANAATEAGAGVTSLQQQGYYVRIARKPGEHLALPADRKPVAVIVEDEPTLADFLGHFMRFQNFDVRMAANREEIVNALRQAPRPDLVLLDVVLPDADGFDILAKVRQHPALASVPVIMLTAKATRESVIKGLAGGANGYITKPFHTEILLKAIQTLFGMEDAPPGDVWNDRK